MSFEAMLTQSVTIAREVTTNDSAGAVSVATTETVITRAAIWQASAGMPFQADRLTPDSTHVLAMVPGDYIWDYPSDRYVVEGFKQYEVVGRPDNIMGRGIVEAVGLRRVG